MIRFGSNPDPKSPADRTAAPDYFSRREQFRLLILVFMLMLVVVLMVEAGKPENWRWLWRGHVKGPAPASDSAGSVGGAPRQTHTDGDAKGAGTPDSLQGSDRKPAVDERGLLRGIEPADLDQLRDNSVFLPSETKIWNRWLRILSTTDEESLEHAAVDRVGFVQLFHQIGEYRGRLVSVGGLVRRAHFIKASDHDAASDHDVEIDGYWRCWLFPGDSGTSPVVVYALEMPEGFPEGLELEEKVEFAGVVYKRWAFRAAGGITLAPLIMAKTGRWSRPAATARPTMPGIRSIVGVAVIAGLLGVVGAWVAGRRTRGRSRPSRSRGVVLPENFGPVPGKGHREDPIPRE